MAIKEFPEITCSLTKLGYIYNLKYDYAPMEGSKITAYFVREDGLYDTKNILSTFNRVLITIKGTIFNMYAVSFKTSFSVNQKVLEVNFIDDTFKLKNYYLCLPGSICSNRPSNIYTVDVVTQPDLEPAGLRNYSQDDYDAKKEAENWDRKKAFRDATTFKDEQYTFGSFLNVLRMRFNVTTYGVDQTSSLNSYVGSFQEVLNSWCADLGLSYFFNPIDLGLHIFDAADHNNNVIFPETHQEALNETYSESMEHTYSKQAVNIFKTDGEIYQRTGSLISTLTLKKILNCGDSISIENSNGEFVSPSEITQAEIQMALATIAGKENFFLFVYAQDSMDYGKVQEGDGKDYFKYLGLTRLSYRDISDQRIRDNFEITIATCTLNAAELYLMHFDETVLDHYFNYFSGLYAFCSKTYILDGGNTSINFLQKHQWQTLDGAPINISVGYGLLKGSNSNGFNGVISRNPTIFIEYGVELNVTVDPSAIGTARSLFTSITKGIDMSEGSMAVGENLKMSNSFLVNVNNPEGLPPNFDVALLKNSGKVIGIKGFYEYQIEDYYPKQMVCSYGGGPDSNVMYNLLDMANVSPDAPITVYSPSGGKKMVDLTPITSTISKDIAIRARGRSFVSKSKSFTINFFIDIVNYIGKGLESLTISFNDKGMEATYLFSNSYMVVPNNNSLLKQMDRQMRESQRRGYITRPYYGK